MVERRMLARPATEAAALVLDWSRDTEWRGAVTSMQVEPPGPARAGQRIVERLRFAGLPFVTPTAIIALGEGSASFAGGSGTVAVTGRRTVVPDGDDACTVVLGVDVRLRGPLAALTPLLAPGYRRRHRADADALTALATTQA
jgi:hypothetical protein